jgi:hypothetical protein
LNPHFRFFRVAGRHSHEHRGVFPSPSAKRQTASTLVVRETIRSPLTSVCTCGTRLRRYADISTSSSTLCCSRRKQNLGVIMLTTRICRWPSRSFSLTT